MPSKPSWLSKLSPIARSGVAVVSGLIASFIVVAAVEVVSVLVHPRPSGLDFGNTDALGAYIATLPASAFVLVSAAWLIGALVGGALAGWLGGRRADVDGGIVGLILAVSSVKNLLDFAHPAWMWAPALLTVPVAWYAARWVMGRERRAGVGGVV